MHHNSACRQDIRLPMTHMNTDRTDGPAFIIWWGIYSHDMKSTFTVTFSNNVCSSESSVCSSSCFCTTSSACIWMPDSIHGIHLVCCKQNRSKQKMSKGTAASVSCHLLSESVCSRASPPDGTKKSGRLRRKETTDRQPKDLCSCLNKTAKCFCVCGLWKTHGNYMMYDNKLTQTLPGLYLRQNWWQAFIVNSPLLFCFNFTFCSKLWCHRVML